MTTIQRTLGALAATALLASACGDSNDAEAADDQPDAAASFPADRWQESEVAAHLELSDDGYYTSPGGLECETAVVLASPGNVEMYVEAGDMVATNPDQTAGVKLGWNEDQQACHQALTEALSTLTRD